MYAIDSRVPPALLTIGIESHTRHDRRDRHRHAESGTYGEHVPAPKSGDPRVRAFAAFVKRALDEAKDRGLSIEDVEAKTDLGRSTIYRWRRAETESPQRKQVQAFCRGLGIPTTVASQILGWDDQPPSPSPDPMIDPDLRAVARRLADPSVSVEEKTSIRATLRYLAKGG